jgi:glycosyltransferase involved in cell wall biosynthesis
VALGQRELLGREICRDFFERDAEMIGKEKDFNMPRIAMYIWFFAPFVGGAEKQCKILSGELVKKGIPVFIVTERLKGTKKYEIMNGIPLYRVSGLNWLRRLPDQARRLFGLTAKKESRVRGINRFSMVKWFSRILTYKVPNYYFFISSLWTFYKKRKDFEILHIHESQDIACFGIKIAKLLNKKVIIKELISGDLLESPDLLKNISKADCFIAISDEISDNMISMGLPKERVKKIPNGVDLSSDMWKNDCCSERPVMCMTKINQLPNKGIDVLLEAWSILVHEYSKPLKLQIFGRGNPDLFDRMLADFSIKDHVRFSGFSNDVRKNLLGASLFVLPSRREGLSNSLLEAMSIGIPCIATDISGNRDLIRHGKNGLLVLSEDPKSLADGVMYMLDNPDKARSMGEEAKKTVKENYAISTIADKYVQLYLELVKNDKE